MTIAFNYIENCFHVNKNSKLILIRGKNKNSIIKDK